MHLFGLLNLSLQQLVNFQLVENFLFNWDIFSLFAHVQEHIEQALKVFWASSVLRMELDRVEWFRLMNNTLVGLVVFIGEQFLPPIG